MDSPQDVVIPRNRESTPSTPTTSKSTPAESDAITSSLAARRRRSLGSIFREHKTEHGTTGPIASTSASTKQKGRRIAGNEQAIREEQEQEQDLDEDDDEQEENEEAMRVATIDFEAYTKAIGDPVKLMRRGGGAEGDAEEVNLEEVGGELAPEYVWDVLFENQRGIFFAGTGYFSSRGLLPADPSPFTRPSDHLPSASSFSITHPSGSKHVQPAGHVEGSNQHQHHRKGKGKNKPSKEVGKLGRSNKTSYTLETYQPPLPDWEYLTPWMINMRTGTDELGWRYNAWFKKKGWSSHAGPLGWGGWVRRREWVRLRYVVPRAKMEQGDGKVDLSDRENVEKKAKKLEEVLESNDKVENVASVLSAMGKLSVDRERLEVWGRWLDKAKKDSEAWKRLEELCSDDQAVGVRSLQVVVRCTDYDMRFI
ncbi:hypothetical protein CI109_101689 [Kwoniella shandongensis]|uniref:Uncharacterized protein n=1 Tax=Kwoniella shandongensis TaxID=1734106 RepID=A0A5M6C5K3_9TREE|nr:uncharacterized protein CI109_001187 [Kwoniella shandongensis]KAA5530384.1 hypothetical protein CI109_001187 [Kwoniella shandongensis]